MIGNRHSGNMVRHHATVTRECRKILNGHRSAVVWFTGLSGAGKSTLAYLVEEQLHRMGCRTFVLDGDNIRRGLCADLGFSREDRAENIRRVGEVVKLFVEAGIIVLTAFISPFRLDRENVRRSLREGDFIEVYCRCPLEICEQRDVKGFYRRARAGEIKDFTGVSSPYEEPESPELVINTAILSVNQCVEQVLDLLLVRKLVPR